ncbi:hypothetical protein [Streptomyces sp. 061-3]|uniref:hypothetical protein n=1 Tax=Streptomyces sp. 061-3 TaxID=2789268 RepID=UPI00397EA68D
MLVLPRRTICCSRRPSWSVSLRTESYWYHCTVFAVAAAAPGSVDQVLIALTVSAYSPNVVEAAVVVLE